jgi:hypothetical protein
MSQFVQPSLDEPPLGLLPGQFEGTLVGGARVGRLPDPAEEIGSRSVRQAAAGHQPLFWLLA